MPCVSNVDSHVGNYANNGIEGTTEGCENHDAIGDIALAFFIILTDTGDNFIRCCSSSCPVGKFHQTCYNVPEDLGLLGCATGSAALPVVSPGHTYIASARKMPVARCLSVLGETPAKVAGGTMSHAW